MKKFIIVNGDTNANKRKIDLKGLDLTRFKANPVMYYNHQDYTKPIGYWDNIQEENINGQDVITAVAVFDEKDELGAEIKRKVDKGFIKGASIQYVIKEWEYITEPVLVNGQNYEDKIIWVKKAEVLETSVVDIPANRIALATDKFTFADGVTPFSEILPKENTDTEKVTDSKSNSQSILYKVMNVKNISKGLLALIGWTSLDSVKQDEADNLLLAPAQVDTLNAKVADMQKNYESLKAEKDSLKTENDSLKTEKDALQTELNKAKDQIAIMSGKTKKDGADAQVTDGNKPKVDIDNFEHNKAADKRQADIDSFGVIVS